MAFDQVWRNATLKKGLRDPGTQFEGGEGEEGEDNEPNLWEAFAPRSHKSQPIMVKSTIG